MIFQGSRGIFSALVKFKMAAVVKNVLFRTWASLITEVRHFEVKSWMLITRNALKCILGHLLTHHIRFESNMADTDVILGGHYPKNLESMYFRYFSSNLEDISGKSYVLRVKKFIHCLHNKLWPSIECRTDR